MPVTHRYARIMSGQGGPSAELARVFLRGVGKVYETITRYRNFRYDTNPRAVTWLDTPVVSVGNITTGGTGKTPLVMWCAQRLIELGRKPAILSRGYKSSEKGSDEVRLVSRLCPEAVCVANPDRVAAALMAIDEYEADVLLLDDGFQHRKLGRDLDIVTIDATCPLGYGYVLPRGLLRELPHGLGRAGLIVLTRCDQVSASDLTEAINRVRSHAPDVAVIRSNHKATCLVDLSEQELPVSAISGMRCLLSAGIGNPQAFAGTVRGLGGDPLGAIWWPDHHNYSEADAAELADVVTRHDAAALVVTEKDILKLADLDVEWPRPVYAVRVEIEFLDDGRQVILQHLEKALATNDG